MRGLDIQQDHPFNTVSPEQLVPKDHALGPIRQMVDEALAVLDEEFDALHADLGRESIPPENLLQAQVLPRRGPPICSRRSTSAWMTR